MPTLILLSGVNAAFAGINTYFMVRFALERRNTRAAVHAGCAVFSALTCMMVLV